MSVAQESGIRSPRFQRQWVIHSILRNTDCSLVVEGDDSSLVMLQRHSRLWRVKSRNHSVQKLQLFHITFGLSFIDRFLFSFSREPGDHLFRLVWQSSKRRHSFWIRLLRVSSMNLIAENFIVLIKSLTWIARISNENVLWQRMRSKIIPPLGDSNRRREQRYSLSTKVLFKTLWCTWDFSFLYQNFSFLQSTWEDDLTSETQISRKLEYHVARVLVSTG